MVREGNKPVRCGQHCEHYVSNSRLIKLRDVVLGRDTIHRVNDSLEVGVTNCALVFPFDHSCKGIEDDNVYSGKAFALSTVFDWELIKEEGYTVLVPLKKEVEEVVQDSDYIDCCAACSNTVINHGSCYGGESCYMCPQYKSYLQNGGKRGDVRKKA